MRVLPAALGAVLLLTAAPAAAQRAATAPALVRVPPVALMAVEPVPAAPGPYQLASTSATPVTEGAARVRVRANHGWQLLVASPADRPGRLWVRAVTAAGAGELRLVEPGREVVVAEGSRGDEVVRVEYRWADADPGMAPLSYTLSSR